MKTWRERIQEARERGAFTREDQLAWEKYATCPAGEVVKGITGVTIDTHQITMESIATWAKYGACWDIGNQFCDCIYDLKFNPDLADKLLDQIEERALEIKRGEA